MTRTIYSLVTCDKQETVCICQYLLKNVYLFSFRLNENLKTSFKYSHQPFAWITNVTILLICFVCVSLFFLNYLFIYFQREGEGKEKDRERNINVWLPITHPFLGTWPATQACVLTGNQMDDPLIHRPELSPLSYTSRAVYLFTLHHNTIFFPEPFKSKFYI